MSKLFRMPSGIGWRDHVIGALLCVAVVVTLLLTAGAIGFTRDEGMYFHASTLVARWFEDLWTNSSKALRPGAIADAWAYNREHPSFIKSLFALSWLFLHNKWHLIADSSLAFRLPAMVLSGVAVWVTYLFGARVYCRSAGLVASVLFITMPRVFFHAHLACFDMPIVALWVLCLYVYYRSIERGGVVWPLVCGLVYGLALDTKHNAWILPFVFLVHGTIVILTQNKGCWKKPLVRVSSSFAAIIVLGPVLLYALWPWIWYDTKGRLLWYFNFQFNHVYYNMEFLGTNYFKAPSPRLYMPIMILATVPTITLLFAGIGAGNRVSAAICRIKATIARAASHTDGLDFRPNLLFGLAAVAAVSPWFLGKTPIYGGTKHWMTAYPFLALFASHGLMLVLRSMKTKMDLLTTRMPSWAPKLASIVSIGLVFLVPVSITAHAHPYGLSSYVPLVGGTKGGASLGLNRQFWGYTTQNAAEQFLNDRAPYGSKVFIHDTIPIAWQFMQAEGRVRYDLRGVSSVNDAQIALVQHELHMNEVDYQIWEKFHTQSPIFVVAQDEVPIVSIYADKSIIERLVSKH